VLAAGGRIRTGVHAAGTYGDLFKSDDAAVAAAMDKAMLAR
jgi:hypothetical protein